MNIKTILEELNSRFKSLNDIPVERASIKAAEWELIKPILENHLKEEHEINY